MKVRLKIKVNSDGNELEFQEIVKGHNIYKYTVSKTKLGQLIGWSDIELNKLIENKIIISVK